MRGLLVFGVLVACVAAQSLDCGEGGCPPTDPPPPVKRCPDCVKDRCSYSMCLEAIGVAFPGDCTKFCICDHVGPIEFHCPDGLYFDAKLGVCAAAYDSTCRNDDPYPECNIAPPCSTTPPPCTTPTPPCTTPTPCTTPCPTTAAPCTTPTTPCTTPCPTTAAPCTTPTTPCTTPCPTTAPCTTPTTPCTTPCPTTAAPCTTPTTSCTTPCPTTSCTTTTAAPVVRCPECVNQYCTYDMCSQAKHITYPGDCTKFCKCDHVGAIEFTCPDGLFFNPTLEVCDWPYNVNCGACKNMAMCG